MHAFLGSRERGPRTDARGSGVLAGATIALLVCGGCAPSEPPEPVGESASAEIVSNGLHLNGLHLNGLHLNGLDLNGLHLNGLALNGLYLNGLHLNGVTLSGGVLTAQRPDGSSLTDLTGVEVRAAASDGTPVTLRIDAVAPGTQADLVRYAVSYRAADGSSEPLCGVGADGPIQALALRGAWDESAGTPTGGAHVDDADVFTFACEGFALAKCVNMGYAPWRTATECRASGDCHEVPLAPLHQACTRMMRADYCGDGTSTTRDGTLVDVWDALGLQNDEAPSWTFEAEWTANGAACVENTRWPTILDQHIAVVAYMQQHCPARWTPQSCGESSSTFFAANGFGVAPDARVLLRTRIDRGN
jgi:hypothetical protein